MSNMSMNSWLQYRDGVLVSLDLKHDGSLNVDELLDFINDIDMQELMYNKTELRSRNLEKVKVRKSLLEKYFGDESICNRIVHPDSFFSVKDIEIDNEALKGKFRCSLFDGFYKLVYIGQASRNSAINHLLYDGDTINESYLLPTLSSQGIITGDKSCIVASWFYYCDGLMILVNDKYRQGIDMIKCLEKSLKSGNLMLVNDSNKNLLHIVFKDKIEEV